MSLIRDIAATYRAPRAVMRRHLAAGQREDRALVYLMLGCGLIFLASWPKIAATAYLDDAVPLDAAMGGALLGWLFLAPLALYGLAAFAHLVARLFGGQGTWYSARLALFWALLAASPLWLLNGLALGFAPDSGGTAVTGFIGFAVFVFFWGMAMLEAERASNHAPGVPV